MHDPETWLRVAVSMIAFSVAMGAGAVFVLSQPALAAEAALLLPWVAVGSCVVAPLCGMFVAPRLRIRHWGRAGWQRGDFLSGGSRAGGRGATPRFRSGH